MRPIARTFAQLILADAAMAHLTSAPAGKQDFDKIYKRLLHAVNTLKQEFTSEGLNLDQPKTESPDWCRESANFEPNFAERLRGLIEHTRYPQSLAAALFGFTGNSEGAIQMAKLADDIIVKLNSAQADAMRMNSSGELADQYYFGERDATWIIPKFEDSLQMEASEENVVNNCDKWQGEDYKICFTLKDRYRRAR